MKRARPNGTFFRFQLAVLLGVALWLTEANHCPAQSFQSVDYPGAITTELLGISGTSYVGYEYSSGSQNSFLFNGSSYTTLNYPGTGLTTVVGGISGNNVVGTYYVNGILGGADAFLYNDLTNTYASADCPLGYTTTATGISGSHIVGTCNYDAGGASGFFYNGATYISLMYPSARRTEAKGVWGNDVVGTYVDSTGEHGFLYNGFTYQSLNYPSATTTEALGISGNNVVGSYTMQTGSTQTYGSFLYNGSTYTDLTAQPGTEGLEALGIDGLNIVGTYADTSGVAHGFIETLPVPEPAAASLLPLGAATLLLSSRRRRTHATQPQAYNRTSFPLFADA